MTAAKKQQLAKKKKRHVAKHVLLQQQKATTGTTPDDSTPTVKKQKQKKDKRHIKDPSEVTTYLVAWKEQRQDWKFNKNTQSWLLRHCFNDSKLNKATFALFLEYAAGLQGQSKIWAYKEATRRAKRYKDYEANNSESAIVTSATATASEKVEANIETNPTNEKQVDNKEEEKEALDEQAQWQALDYHAKRKEYKRARKVLDVLSRKSRPQETTL
jgi:hypothetical protein